MARVRLISLTCNITEDSSTSDEAYIEVTTLQGTKRVWGGPKGTPIVKHQTINLHAEVNFQGFAVVRLLEYDTPDPDDFLGTLLVTAAEAGQGLKPGRFTEDDADYTLYYEVV